MCRLADVTVVVLVPGMGDDVQAIKAGIMEIADLFVINESDRPGADALEHELRALVSFGARDGWEPAILHAVATQGQGIAEVLTAVREVAEREANSGRRVRLWATRLREMLRERLLDRFSAEELEAAAVEVAARRRDPYSIIHEWLERQGL